MTRGPARFILPAFVTLMFAFLLAPIAIVVLAAFNAGEYLTFPPQGLSLRWFENFFASRPFMSALWYSLRLALWVTLVATVLGTLASLFVVRHARRLRDFLRVLFVAPLAFPSILTGIALLIYFYALGIGTRGGTALVVGHVLVCTPFVFISVSAVLLRFDSSIEEASRSLGAGPVTTFRRVTLPLIKGGVVSGAVLAFITSFDQFPISLLLSGIGTTTLPVQLFDYLRFSFDPTAAAASTVSVLITVFAVILTERFVGLGSVYGERR
jgi:putative spermidine/putrescine transport system permease protein